MEKTMNLLQKLEMKSKSATLNFLLFFLLITFSSQASTKFEDVAYYRKSFVLKLNKNGTFTNNDTVLTNQLKGKWTVKNNNITLLSQCDSTQVSNQFDILYSSENKITFNKDGKRFSYHDKISSEGTGITFTSIFRGVLGLGMLFLLGFLLSKNRQKIDWSLVARGTALQIGLALLILRVPFVSTAFDWLSKAFTKLINFSHDGANFLFRSLGTEQIDPMFKNFMTWILPSIIFFAAISSLLYYLGILQWIVKRLAWVMNKTLGISGAESISAAANIFIGQTEAPLLVKPYLQRMTNSEIMCLMVGGMATIAGGVLAAVIGILGGGDELKELFYAKHLLTASFMSAPAAIVFAKMLVPETEEIDKNLDVPKEKIGANALEAITNGTTEGLKLAANVGAMLIVFMSLIALVNYSLGKIGDWTTLNDLIATGGMYTQLSFESIAGYVLAPVSWMMGVEWQDCMYFGQLLGEKTILNEFIAYPHLGVIQDELSQKTVIMSTYVLCGFANIASIGIQVGGIGILVPEKRSVLAKYGVTALIGGTLACMSTAILAGILF
ncbi:MAG: nucleoside transporter C-terminal domain-containing protein [Crocinitomicaceae bacterium]|nr:nucleoside transporter C-terminal domain-containing protein [Crocinitomicaceae bacterium]